MPRATEGLSIIMNEKELEAHLQRKKAELQEKKKPILLRELQNELRHLDEIDDNDFKDNQDPYINDSTLDRLQLIAKEATKLELKQIEKLCKLAIGKRILNIELKKKKDEHNSKLLKKEKIELFFRENRIKRYDYQSLIDQKLKENTLIVKAYDNGKGFVESDRRYKDKYDRAIQECDYMNTIKEVNKIFYKNYSGISRERLTLNDIISNAIWVPIVVFVCLALTLPFFSFPYEEVILMGLLGLILVILFYISVKTFINKPNHNNQIEQSIEDVRAFFEEVNRNYEQRAVNIEWNCSKDFMYLEVIFHDGLPQEYA